MNSSIYLILLERGIPTKSIHNASIMNAIGCCGLQLYNFGETVSIPFWTDEPSWKPESFYDKIVKNLKNEQHPLTPVWLTIITNTDSRHFFEQNYIYSTSN